MLFDRKMFLVLDRAKLAVSSFYAKLTSLAAAGSFTLSSHTSDGMNLLIKPQQESAFEYFRKLNLCLIVEKGIHLLLKRKSNTKVNNNDTA